MRASLSVNPALTLRVGHPSPAAVLQLLKPVTWFPPMWAFACGTISAGAARAQSLPLARHALLIAAGVMLSGPLLCGTSQAVNDWFDRDVDAINEPARPIPSGRVGGRWGLYVALLGSALSLLWAATLGMRVLVVAIVGLLLAWAYSAPPLRLKRNGWWGNLACGVSYEGLAWIAGAAVMSAPGPVPTPALALASLYSIGAHGIMTLNDFKSMDGDRRCGIRSLPVQLGARRAAGLACLTMAVPQLAVAGLLWHWQAPRAAAAVLALLLAQGALMTRLLADPRARAAWYSALGVSLFVSGMMVSAFAVRGLVP